MIKNLILILPILFLGCTNLSEKQDDKSLINELADSYFDQTINFHPEYAYFADIALDNHSEISSNSLEDLQSWETYEDSLYERIKDVDFSELTSRKDKITYWFLKEELESSIAMRVCKRNLWNVDPEDGLIMTFLIIAQVQPVGSDDFRKQAMTRWNKFPDLMNTEIKNLKLGLSQGYSMPKEIVNVVINQLYDLCSYGIQDSPFMIPARTDGSPSFHKQWESLITDSIIPSIKEYQKFLEIEYLPKARNEVSIQALPNGEQCYQAYIRKYTTVNKTGHEIFEEGQAIVAKNSLQIKKLGKELYDTDNFDEIITCISNDTSNHFSSEEEITIISDLLINKAKNESGKWFTELPSTEVSIKPYEAHENGVGAYEGSAGDKPPYFRINLNNFSTQEKGKNEVLVFHETYPGHHIQIALEKEIGDLHPIVKLISFTSYVEGWARYCEQLAEEMNLYESKSALITRRAWPSRGMVVDPGIHAKGWTKKQAIDYMKKSGMSNEVALSLYHRSIRMPAQLTSYDVGGEEIKALRTLAEKEMGDKFDIKEFHSMILRNGAIPLSALRTIIEVWIEET